MPNLLTYSKFYSAEEADEFTRLLDKSKIGFEIVHERDLLDKIYVGETLDPMISVKIPEDRFEDVNKILLSESQSNLTDIAPTIICLIFLTRN